MTPWNRLHRTTPSDSDRTVPTGRAWSQRQQTKGLVYCFNNLIVSAILLHLRSPCLCCSFISFGGLFLRQLWLSPFSFVRLSGEILAGFGRLHLLTRLNLGNNHLTGKYQNFIFLFQSLVWWRPTNLLLHHAIQLVHFLLIQALSLQVLETSST